MRGSKTTTGSKPKKGGRPPAEPIWAGKIYGHLKIVQKVNTKPGSNGGQRYRVECVCGTRLTIPIFYLVRKAFPKTHCGCKAKEGVNPYPREKGIWQMMHRRCYHSDHVAYKHYGGAEIPITVCPEWHRDNPDGWANFIRDMGPAPSKGHTLDRENPYKGYSKGNCRWATKIEQANNLKRHWKKPT